MKKFVWLYLALNACSNIGDVFFLFFTVLATLKLPHGGFFSGVLFALSSIVRIAIAPIVGRWVDTIPYAIRWKWSLFAGTVLVFLAMFPGLFPPIQSADYFWFCPLMLLIHAIGNLLVQLRMELPFRLAENQIFALTKYTSFTNLFTRGIFVAAPALASMIPSQQWLTAASINAVSFLFAVFAAVIGHIHFRNLKRESQTRGDKVGAVDFKKLANWNNWFFFLTNLCLGGVGLILTAFSPAPFDPILNILPPVSVLYAGSIISFLVILFWPRNDFVEKTNINHLLFSVMMTSLMLATASTKIVFLIIPALFSGGLFYGVSLITIAPAVTRHFNGGSLTVSVSQADAIGRMGSVFSSLGIGFLLDHQLTPSMLLQVVSVCGCLSVAFLFWLKRERV